MAQFDVHRLPDAAGLLLDCQSDLLRDLKTRLVIPLRPDAAPSDVPMRLTPIVTVEDRRYLLMTHLATSIPRDVLRMPVASLATEYLRITGAIDMLVSGI